MQRIINFILRNKTSLLYLFLLLIGLVLTIQNNTYHRTRYFNSANWLSGSVYSASASVTDYFGLYSENQKLAEENRRLRQLLINSPAVDSTPLDTTGLTYEVFAAQVIKNSYSQANNYITINKGARDSIRQDMGVITPLGILGIVERSSANFASVQSILNTRSNINAKIAGADYFGSLTWNRRDFRFAQLEDIPRLVPLKAGDTIVTGAMSSIFPEGIPIGTIHSFDLNESNSFYHIEVRLFNDMTNLRQVYVIRNRFRPELLRLESEISDEQ